MHNSKIIKKDKTLVVQLEKSVDATNCDEILNSINENLCNDAGISKIEIDVANLEYISSAGLQILLPCKNKVDEVFVINASEEIYNIFKSTGFLNLFDVKKA